MVSGRPYHSDQALLNATDAHWWSLGRDDWLEAFAAHPKIGDVESLRTKYAATKQWSANEQSGADTADDVTIQALSKANKQYEQTFGYIFIVCATGKSADEMLAILRQRLENDPDTEIRQAAAEQLKITHLRLQKLHK
jgi:2-oxo-4-hydroxy-4-carboxy-5-ureidoimidazoline decarboxylase